MKKITALALASLFSLSATPKAVVFDFAGVLASRNQKVMTALLRDTFQFSTLEFDRHYQAMVQSVNQGRSENGN